MFVAHELQICLRTLKGSDMLSHDLQVETTFFFLSVVCVKVGWFYLMMQNWQNRPQATMNSCQAKVQSIVVVIHYTTNGNVDQGPHGFCLLWCKKKINK